MAGRIESSDFRGVLYRLRARSVKTLRAFSAMLRPLNPPARLGVLPVCLGFLLGAANLYAASDDSRFLTLISENDNYVPSRQDRHYTNGIFLSYGFPKGYRAPWLDWLGNVTPLPDRIEEREYAIAIGQNLYGPESLSSPEPMPADRPFAGWLYGEVSVTARSPGIEEHLAVNIGLVGPAALGKETQTLIHEITDDPAPLGWRNQLHNEPAFLMRYRRSWFTPITRGDGLELDLVSRAGLTAGNVVTEAGVGAVLRLGSFLFERDVPQRLQPGLSGNATRFDARPNEFDWFIFFGAQGRAVLHNLFLDGNTFEDSLSVKRKPLAWDVEAGVSFSVDKFFCPLMFSFSFVWRGEEFDGQDGPDKFGSSQLSVRF